MTGVLLIVDSTTPDEAKVALADAKVTFVRRGLQRPLLGVVVLLVTLIFVRSLVCCELNSGVRHLILSLFFL